MKIRIQNQKLIYRLQNEDLAFFEQNKYCEESLQIATQKLIFSLHAKKVDEEKVLFENNFFQVIVPENKIQQWLHSDIVEIEFVAGKTQVIIEKDLKEFRRHASR